VLELWYEVAFGLEPLHIAVIMNGLRCSIHVVYRSEKATMAKAYRLSMNGMAFVMDDYTNQLAEQYDMDVALKLLVRSRSKLNLNFSSYLAGLLQLPFMAGSMSGTLSPVLTSTGYIYANPGRLHAQCTSPGCGTAEDFGGRMEECEEGLFRVFAE